MTPLPAVDPVRRADEIAARALAREAIVRDGLRLPSHPDASAEKYVPATCTCQTADPVALWVRPSLLASEGATCVPGVRCQRCRWTATIQEAQWLKQKQS